MKFLPFSNPRYATLMFANLFPVPKSIASGSTANETVPTGIRHLSDVTDSEPPATVKYTVNGKTLSYDEVLAVNPEERTIAHWLVLLDWNQQRQRPYVIVDPWDPSGLLYLRYDEYLVQMRTLAASNVPVLVVARPGSKAPVPQKYPPFSAWRSPFSTDIGSTWKHFRDLRKWIFRNTTWGPDSSVKVHDGNIGGLVRMWYREVSHLLGQGRALRREPRIDPFVNHLIHVTKVNGVTFAIQRLKISLFALYSYLGGNPLKTTEPLGQRVRLSCGLPAFLGVDARRALRTRSPESYRLWASLFNIYKALHGKHGSSPLETIEASAFIGDLGDWASFVGGAGQNDLWDRWERQFGPLPPWKYESAFGLPVVSAGANMPLSLASISLDAVAWTIAPRNWVMEWFEMVDDQLAIKLFNDASTNADADWIRGGEEVNSFSQANVKLSAEIEALPSGRLKAALSRSLPTWHLQEAYDKYVKYTFGGKSHDILANLKGLHYRRMTKLPSNPLTDRPVPCTGRLHSLYEAAGKVRVIAICDYFTQMALYPLHKYIFSILKGTVPQGLRIDLYDGKFYMDPKSLEVGTPKALRTRKGKELLDRLSNDATFDQQSAVDWFAAQGHMEIFSYDLKSATDLIPRELYVEVLGALLGRPLASLWCSLISDRRFLAPRDVVDELVRTRGSPYVRYGRGQPMGAYSSWAALALVHHALVQYAAAKAGYTDWFPLYLVLGDDIVIADPKVAEAYLEVCAQFGIKVGLAKSLVSKTGLMNFASQTLIGRENVSPISLKEVLQANTWEARAELSRRVCHRLGLDPKLFHNFARRVLSVPQWGTIVPELTGLVPEWNTRFVRWFLHNPVRPFDGRPEMYIENVVSWLGLLSPVVLTFSSELRDTLERNIAKRVWTEVRAESASLLRHFEDARWHLNGIIEALKGGFYLGPTTVDLYIAEISRTMVSARVKDFQAFKRKWEPWLSAESEPPHLTPCLEAWLELRAGWKLPGGMLRTFTQDKRTYMLTDLLVSHALQEECDKGPKQEAAVRRTLPRDLTPLIPEDRLKAPIKAILLGLADTVGVALPVGTLVPKFLDRHLTAELRRAKDDYWLSRSRRDASPCLNMVGLEAWQVAPVSVPAASPANVVVREGRSSYLDSWALGNLAPYSLFHGDKVSALPETRSRLGRN